MFIIGDTHGIRPVFEIIDKHKITDSHIIHVGDFGLGFETIGRDIKNLEILDEMLLDTNNKLYVIRGNHDNPIFWDKSKGLNLPKFHNLRLVDDYTVLEIEKQKVLFVGGAISIDRRPRMNDFPYPTWWKDEVFKYEPDRLDTVVKKHKDIDIVITHTAPKFCHPVSDDVSIVNHYQTVEAIHGIDLKAELRAEREDITEMFDDLIHHYHKRPKHWFYGHFHSSKNVAHKIDEGVTCQFHLLNVNELWELPDLNEVS